MLAALRPAAACSALPLSRTAAPGAVRFSSSRAFQPVDLAFDLFEPKTVTVPDQNLVICHGLFGSKQNWRSMAKAFAQKLGMNVYTLDMRNHGVSPTAAPMSYEAMSADIAQFITKQGLDKPSSLNLVGHSMGAKASAAFALNGEHNKSLRTFTSIDMSPAEGPVSPVFMEYVKGMKDVDAANVSSRSQADKILAKYESALGVRQFLLTNMTTETDAAGKNLLRFRIPLDLLAEEIPRIGSFPYTPPPPVTPTSPQWTGPTVFIKGSRSKYINDKNIPVCKAYFPNCTIETLEAGHWVHSEKPLETLEIITKLVQGTK